MGPLHRPPPRNSSTARGFRPWPGAFVTVMVLCNCSPQQPQPVVTGVFPREGYTDQVTMVQITGSGFIPAYVFDLEQDLTFPQAEGFSGQVSGAAGAAALRNFQWKSATTLQATLDKGLAGPGFAYNVRVIDPRGQSATLPNAFVSLGKDTLKPEILILQPDPQRPVARDNVIQVEFRAHDLGPGSLASMTYSVWFDGKSLAKGKCEVAATSGPTHCRFEAQVPATAELGKIFTLKFAATDASFLGNQTTLELPFTVVSAPVLDTISPRRGILAGGTDVVVRGANFPVDAKVLIGGQPLLPDGGRWLDGTTVVGRTPPGIAGRASVEIRALTGSSELSIAQDFTYLKEMTVRSVKPEQASSGGGTPVRVTGEGITPLTAIIFGDRPTTGALLAQPVQVDMNVIEGVVPPGVGSTFVWAVDPELGKARWSGTFSWVPAAAKDSP